MPAWVSRLLNRLASNQRTPVDVFRTRPEFLFQLAGLNPDPWQTKFLRSVRVREMVCASRQIGKSTTVAALALLTALLEAPADVLVVSPSERQSGEFVRKVQAFYSALKRPRKTRSRVQRLSETAEESQALDAAWQALPDKERESALQLHLKNGSRIIGLPSKPDTLVGYSAVTLLVMDEAARIGDELYRAVRPMLAVSRGRLVALSTPKGKRGWFYEAWSGQTIDGKVLRDEWGRHEVRAVQCPRLLPEFLADEEAALGDRWFRQEYGCSFEAAIDSVFDPEDVKAALVSGTPRTLGGFKS